MRRTLTFISIFALMISMLALPAAADSNPVEFDPWQSGSAESECQELVTEGLLESFDFAYKFDGVVDGRETETVEGNTITIEANEQFLDWLASDPISAVIVVAASKANVWIYEPPAISDQDLLSPATDSISHVTFCWNDESFTPDGTVSLSKDATASFDVDVDWALDKKVRQRGEGFGNKDLTNDLQLVGEPGDSFLLLWRILATRTDGAPYNHTVSGVITVSNSSTNTAVTVDLADELSKEGVKVGDATVDCDDEGATSVTVAAGAEEFCSYTATETAAKVLPDLNTVSGVATATDPDGFEEDFPIQDATAVVSFTTNFKGETNPLLADPEFDLSKNISETTTENIRGKWDCPPTRSELYDANGIYVKTLTNTATLAGEGLDLEDSAKVTLTCYDDVFEGETAWAANGNTDGELRYNQRGNWATYVQYDGREKTTTLFAGQTIDVGSVTFSAPDDAYNMVTITVELTGDWEFEDVAENLKVQDYLDEPSGNPEPGQFDHKKDCDAASNTCSIEVPANNYYGVHVNVGQWVPNPLFPS